MKEVEELIDIDRLVHSFVHDVEDREPHALDLDLALIQPGGQEVTACVFHDVHRSLKLRSLYSIGFSYEVAGRVVGAAVAHDKQVGIVDAWDLELKSFELNQILSYRIIKIRIAFYERVLRREILALIKPLLYTFLQSFCHGLRPKNKMFPNFLKSIFDFFQIFIMDSFFRS